MLRDEHETVGRSGAGRIFESERQDETATHRFDGLREGLKDERFAPAGRLAVDILPELGRAFGAEQGVDVMLHGVVRQASVDPVVVEEEYAITAPVFRDAIHNAK
jgi:hypothetical protein